MKKIQPNYYVSIPKPESHYFNVKYTFELNSDGQQFLHMPVWTPGSYKVREFSRHISNLTGKIDKQVLPINRINKSSWEFIGNNRNKIEISYQVYAKDMTVRTSYLDSHQAMINGASVFIYSEKHKNAGITLTIDYPKKWKNLITSLPFDNKRSSYIANDFDHLIDAPILIGNPEYHSFTHKNKPHHFAIIGKGNYDLNKIKNDTKKILSSFHNIFAEFPYQSYTFITHLYDKMYGGLEHRDSCHIIFSRWKFHQRKEYIKFISLVAHEYFHTFNIKRIRPKELGPFNYLNENYTNMLWLAEGMTSYYDEYILRRSEVISVKEYFELLDLNFCRYFSIPGRNEMSTKDSSFLAWIKLYIPDENLLNTTVSYYLSGGLIALVLDLKIREITSGKKCLDDVYRELWKKFKTDGKGITEKEFFSYCESVAGDSLDSILSYLNNPIDIDFASAFMPFGLEFKPSYKNSKTKDSAWFGIGFNPKDKLTLNSIRSDGPAGNSELAPGDEIIGINSERMTIENKDNLMKTLPIGKPVKMLINRMGDIMEVDVTPRSQPYDKYELTKVKNPTPSQHMLYESWLNEKWANEE